MKKMLSKTLILLTMGLSSFMYAADHDYEPTVESLKQYETPEWFGDAKFGIWVCWNAYTVPAIGDWYARYMYIEGHPHYKFHLENYGHPSEFGYKDVVQLWKGEEFDAQELVDLFVDIGAKYIVGMANHHDNFDLWDSKYHSWNSVNYGPKRDIIGEFRDAVQKYEDQGIRWGVTSHVERATCWFQTNKGADKTGPYAGIPYDGADEKYSEFYLPANEDGDMKPTQPSNAPEFWRENWLARCKDLFDKYDPDFFYVDGGVPFPGENKGHSGLEMIAHLYNQSKARHDGTNEAVMCIKNWYKKAPKGEWGYYWDGIATLNLERARLPSIRKNPWQTDTSIGDWTYVKDGDYRSATEIIHELIDIVSKNGNMLLNVSPMSNGRLDPQAYALLKEIGSWMKVNGESIYKTRPWETSGVEDIRIVRKGDQTLYVSLLDDSAKDNVVVPYLAPKSGKSLGITSVTILGHEDLDVKWISDEKGLQLELPEGLDAQHAVVFKIKAEDLDNYDNAPIAAIFDRSEELTEWWKSQSVTNLSGKYQKISVDNNNTILAIDKDHNLIEIKNGKETPVGVKAIDVGASASCLVYVGLDGSVYLHTKHFLEWLELPKEEDRIIQVSKDGKEWIQLPGVKAKRCDVGQTGGIWVIGEDHKLAYYFEGAKWQFLDKTAEDIACGGGWVGAVAIIHKGNLEVFEGNHWENRGGGNLKAVDISSNEEIVVTLAKDNTVTAYDLMGSVEVDTAGKQFTDISCGLSQGKEVVVFAK